MGIGLTRLQACNIVHLRFYRPNPAPGNLVRGVKVLYSVRR